MPHHVLDGPVQKVEVVHVESRSQLATEFLQFVSSDGWWRQDLLLEVEAVKDNSVVGVACSWWPVGEEGEAEIVISYLDNKYSFP